jgi:signal transduction histidine kinase
MTAQVGPAREAELTRLLDEQAALRRIATLVARGVEPEQLFASVAEETATAFGAFTHVMRFEQDPPSSVVVGASSGGESPIGTRWHFGDGMASAEVYRTGRPARLGPVDPLSQSGAAVEVALRFDINSQVACPIVVEGTLWGVVCLNAHEELPPDTEQRLEKFTELVTTAIANTTTRAELIASRARIVAAGDEARRRIERNLHDGVQQRLVALRLDLQRMREVPHGERDTLLMQAEQDLEATLEDLRELSHGLHPPLLSRAGLGPSLEALTRRLPIPVHLNVELPERPEASLETALYYAVSEAITNAIKHSDASEIAVTATGGEKLEASIADNGVGGADVKGSGLTGLRDRIEALGGRFTVVSPAAGGTTISIELPVRRTPAAEG